MRVCNNYGVHSTSAVPVQYKHVLVEQVSQQSRNIIIKRTDRRAKGNYRLWVGIVPSSVVVSVHNSEFHCCTKYGCTSSMRDLQGGFAMVPEGKRLGTG